MSNLDNNYSIFNLGITKLTDGKVYNTETIEIPSNIIERLKKYKLEYYCYDVEHLGLEKTWDYICQFVIDNHKNLPKFIDINKFGKLYEIGLVIEDKLLKRKSGQYYTPDDVAKVMCEWLYECDGSAVCDVACGTGKLMLTYLEKIGYKNARQLISSGNLYLYDFDNVALKICRTTIAVKYGLDIADSINDIFCDFLDQNIKLPEDCKVISNPPYAKIEKFQSYWNHSDVLIKTKELYSAFMEKIFKEAKSTVIVTPFSFVSGKRYYQLRKQMCELGFGFILSFDNTPGNIFYGKKYGVFNTNTLNVVRASITVFHRSKEKTGFKISPLIRFKNEEREKLLQAKVLEDILPFEYQIVNENDTRFKKIDKDLINIYSQWIKKSKFTIKDVLSIMDVNYIIDMPNTCRYFTTGSSRKLNRNGSIIINMEEKKIFNFVYCFINSSFTYWWWRIYEGGITYTVSLLHSMPLPINLLNDEDNEYFEKMANELLKHENDYIITNLNSGKVQENIKFPSKYRDSINLRILKMLGLDCGKSVFDKLHSHSYFRKTDDNI